MYLPHSPLTPWLWEHVRRGFASAFPTAEFMMKAANKEHNHSLQQHTSQHSSQHSSQHQQASSSSHHMAAPQPHHAAPAAEQQQPHQAHPPPYTGRSLRRHR